MARTVLVADDSPTIQKKAQGILKGEGFEVETVSNGVAAIKKLAKMNPLVVLADVSMPGKDGYEVCDFVKHSEALHHVPVLLIASDLEPYDEDKGARVRADGKITKPFEPDELIATVSKLAALAESAAAPPEPEPVTAPPAPPPAFEVGPVEEPEMVTNHPPPSFFGSFSEGTAFAEPGPEEASAAPPELPYTPPPPVEAGPAEQASTEPAPEEEVALESPVEAPPEENAIPSEPVLVEEPVAEAPEPDSIPEAEQTLVFRTPAQIAEPVLKDETAPPAEEPPPPEIPEPTPLTASSLDTFTLSEAATGQVSIAPSEAEAEAEAEAQAQAPAETQADPEALPPSEAFASEASPTTELPVSEEPPATESLPEEPAPAHLAVNPGLVLSIVQKTVSKMSPPALPPQIAEEIARKLADEILGELDAESYHSP